VIADNSLLGGFAAGQRPVGVELVSEICRDFDLTPKSGAVQSQSQARLLEVQPPPAPHAAPEDEAGIFGSFSSKRKKFSFFWS